MSMSSAIHKIFLKKTRKKLSNLHAIFEANGPYICQAVKKIYSHIWLD